MEDRREIDNPDDPVVNVGTLTTMAFVKVLKKLSVCGEIYFLMLSLGWASNFSKKYESR